MARTKVIKFLISLIGILLGTWLMLGGLELRILGSFLRWHQQTAFIAYPEHILRMKAIDIGGLTQLAWPMVVFGSSWGGALIGFWIGERWSLKAMFLLAMLAVAFPYIGTLLGGVQILLILVLNRIDPMTTDPDDGT